MWDLPGPGLEPVSPALAGGFLTTVPPGKSKTVVLDQGLANFSTGSGSKYFVLCQLYGLFLNY